MSNKGKLTTNAVAKQLNVSPRTIQLWAESGVLPASKTVGGHRRFNPEDVRALQRQYTAAAEQDKRSPRNLRVLVVEDEPDLLFLYKQQIKRWGLPLDLQLAGDGYEGLIKIGSWQPDVVITDLLMPRIDGVHMINIIAQQKELANTDIIVVTALSPEEQESKGSIPDTVPVYTKPIPFDRLEAHVKARCLSLRDSGKMA